MNDVQVSDVTSRIVHVEFPTQELLAKTFLRFQEFYENSDFKGKVFSREEFLKWYGDDNYFEDWDGFNIPSCVLKPFLEGKFDPLTKEEQAFLDLFQGREGSFYIIGAVGKKNLEHEIAHALFFTDQSYRKKVMSVVKSFDTSRLEKFLDSEGYHPDVWTDEIHAYLLTHSSLLREDGLMTKNLEKASAALRELFEKHAAISIPAS